MHRFGLYLKSRDRWLSRNIAKKSVITNSKQLMQKKSVDSYKDNYGARNWNFVKFVNSVLQKWKNYRSFKVLPSIRSRDENLSRIRTLFWNSQAESRNCKMKWILRIFRMLNQFAVEIPTLPVDQCHSHLIRYLKGCWDLFSYRRAAEKGRQAFGTHMVYRETFLQSTCILISSLSSRIESVEFVNRGAVPFIYSGEKWKTRTKSRSEMPVWTVSQRFSHLSGGDSSKNYGADQQRLQISDLHFDKCPSPATFACWKIRFKTKVCTCSQFPTEAMQWIKEVELVDSVDELRSSSSIHGISMPNFEVLDARIASVLNKIIHNSHFKRRISLEEQKAQKQDSFLRGRQIAYLIYDYFRVTGANDSVENYADLFTIALRNYDIQEFDSKWDGILSMTKIPPDDILEGLHKLRIRESEKLKTVLELYDLETHQKKLGHDYHRLKTMVKRSIEQEIRNKNFGIRNGNFEKNAVVKNQGKKQRVQRILGDCWQWETNGQCSKGDNCSFRHDINKRGKVTPECLFYKTMSGCRFGEKCSYAYRQVDEQPSKRSKKNDDKSAVALLKKGDWHERGPVTDQCHDRSVKPDKRSEKKLGQKSSKRQSSDARQLGLRISRHPAAEVCSPEGHRHAEANPTCEIHRVYCASHKNSRPKSFARICLPRWTSSA